MRLAGEEIDFPGKVMGAQAYGLIDTEFVASLADQEPDLLPRRLLEEIPWRGALPRRAATIFRFWQSKFS
jgi:hypothetical protein